MENIHLLAPHSDRGFAKLQTQKSPLGFHLAGSQDFDDGSGNHQPRILVELAGVEPASEITTPSALHA